MKPVSDGVSRTRSWKGQRGAVAVEMAIVLPLFAILLLGAFEFGVHPSRHHLFAIVRAEVGNQQPDAIGAADIGLNLDALEAYLS